MLSAIAATLLVEPRSSLQALAKVAGISRATLYRIRPPREQLVELLVARSIAVTRQALHDAALDPAMPGQSLERLTARILYKREIFTFPFMQGPSSSQFEEDPQWNFFDTSMEDFILQCQQAGTLRVDVTPA